MTDKLEEKYKVIKLYSETLKGKEFTRSLMDWCMEQGIQVSELPVFLMCIVKIPSLDIDYDEAYRDLVEREWLTLNEHKVFTTRKEVISIAP